MWLLRPLPLLVVAVSLCLAVAGGVTLLGGPDPVTRPSRSPVTFAPTPLAAAPAVVPDVVPDAVPDAAPGPAVGRALAVLAAWDRSRAAAYSSGDVAALRRLYVRGAPAGRIDVRVLQEYVERGLVVRDLELQRSEVDVLVSTGRRLRIAVLERLARATVVAADTEVVLPGDRPERRIVTLVRAKQRWQVAAVVTGGRS